MVSDDASDMAHRYALIVDRVSTFESIDTTTWDWLC